MEKILSVSANNNQYLYPYYLSFKEMMKDYTVGIFILDARGVYTPIEDGRCGVVHVERLPIVKPAVYALTDMSSCAVMREGERIIIFQGVYQTRSYGWKFIDDSFQIKPFAGFTPSTVKRMVLTSGGSERADEQTQDSDESESDDGEYMF
jgi:hypothetical protein